MKTWQVWFAGLVIWYGGQTLCRYHDDPGEVAVRLIANTLIVTAGFGAWAVIRRFRKRRGKAKPLGTMTAAKVLFVVLLTFFYVVAVVNAIQLDEQSCLAATIVSLWGNPTIWLVILGVGIWRGLKWIKSRRLRTVAPPNGSN